MTATTARRGSKLSTIPCMVCNEQEVLVVTPLLTSALPPSEIQLHKHNFVHTHAPTHTMKLHRKSHTHTMLSECITYPSSQVQDNCLAHLHATTSLFSNQNCTIPPRLLLPPKIAPSLYNFYPGYLSIYLSGIVYPLIFSL